MMAAKEAITNNPLKAELVLRQKLIISLTKETTSEQLLSYRRSSTHET
jgi:hypothetical protein